MSYKLLTMPESNPKTAKGLKLGVLTFPLHLAPPDLSGFEVCAMRTAGCTAGCLNTAGRGRFDATAAARVRKTQWYFADRAGFLAALVKDVARAVAYAERRGYLAAFRLNATSDLPWHRIAIDGYVNIMARFPTAVFYDYTKVAKRFAEQLPANYSLTFSLAESNESAARQVLALGGNVAAVFRDKATVARAIDAGMFGFPAVNGDESDLRFLDPRGVIVALYAKGRAKSDQSGFVIDLGVAA